MCEFFTEITVQSSPLISAPGMIRYIQTMHRSGDRMAARRIFESLFETPIIDPDFVDHLLESRASVILTGTTAVLSVPNQWIIEEEPHDEQS